MVRLKAYGRFNWQCVKWEVIWGEVFQLCSPGWGIAATGPLPVHGLSPACPQQVAGLSWVPAAPSRALQGWCSSRVLLPVAGRTQAAPRAQLRVGITPAAVFAPRLLCLIREVQSSLMSQRICSIILLFKSIL